MCTFYTRGSHCTSCRHWVMKDECGCEGAPYKLCSQSLCARCWPCLLSPHQAQQSATVSAPSHSAPSTEPPKATFPAYTQPPTSSSSSSSSSSNLSSGGGAKPPVPVTSKPATLTTTSATSKLIHPDEDISLVSSPGFELWPFTVSNDWYMWTENAYFAIGRDVELFATHLWFIHKVFFPHR